MRSFVLVIFCLKFTQLPQAAKRCATFMKNTLTIIFILISFLTFSQENRLAEIDNEVNSIEKDSILKIKEFNSVILSDTLNETSGLVEWEDHFYTHNDDTDLHLYQLDKKGSITKKIKLNGVKNNDWEELTQDETHFYLGDFGNNASGNRSDLTIFKIAKNSLFDNPKIETISFSYPEQTDFPAKKSEKLFDCEAFFLYQNYFYLFTKNRSKGFDGTTLLYKIPAVAGNHPAQLIAKFKTCSNYNSCVITGASISPDEKRIVLLSHDRIWLFEDFKGDEFLNGKITELALNHYSQKEAVSFKDNDKLIIADERTKKVGGNLYEISINTLKSSN